MGAFEYTALDQRGKERKGVLEGDTARQVRQQLRDKGWAPLGVSEIQGRDEGGPKVRRGLFRRGISTTDLALVTRQFATLVRSGLPVEEALQALSQQTEKARLKSILMAVRARVMEGHPLADALAEFPHVFPDLFRATVSAGEQSGFLDAVLERLADYTETRQALSQKTTTALVYPVLVVIVSVLVVALLMVYVVPQIVQVFEGIGQDLPPLTVGLIALSDFTRDYGLWLLGGLVLVFSVLRWILSRPGPKRRFHGLLLRLPLVGRLVRGLNTARFARTLSILAGSGVPVLEALRISSEVVSNVPMRSAVEDAARRVREGAALHTALERSGYFPPMTLHLIASGEASGKLEAMLERAATSQEREMDVLTGTLTELMGPLLILIMGGMVLVIVLAILLPIFDLNQLVK
ncbi:MAG TPA: type II secretion system protein GspF [Gammaproteobacteria bacterium]|nr:type II secretion system protein GspF [Gammaproteobacteria bacterium]